MVDDGYLGKFNGRHNLFHECKRSQYSVGKVIWAELVITITIEEGKLAVVAVVGC